MWLALAAAPVVLAGCGKVTHIHPRKSFAFIYSYALGRYGDPPSNPPIRAFMRALGHRAHKYSMTIVLEDGNDPAASLRKDLAPYWQLDPAIDGYPLQYKVVAATTPGLTQSSDIVSATKRGVVVIGFLDHVPHESATIGVDPARMGELLAGNLLRWLHGRRDPGQIMLLVPSPRAADHSMLFAGTAAQSEAVLRRALAAVPGAPRIAATVPVDPVSGADGVTARPLVRRALKAHPGVRIILSLTDEAAVGAAAVLQAAYPHDLSGLYVGALGVPALSSRTTVDALNRPCCLRAVVAVSTQTLADALVDMSDRVQDGKRAASVTVPPVVLQRGSPALAAAGHEYRRNDEYAPRTESGPGYTVINPDTL